MKATLQILKHDIEHSNYFNFSDCAITRALKRAGFPELADTGMNLIRITSQPHVHIIQTPYLLKNRVQNMYFNQEEVEDFEYEIEIPDDYKTSTRLEQHL